MSTSLALILTGGDANLRHSLLLHFIKSQKPIYEISQMMEEGSAPKFDSIDEPIISTPDLTLVEAEKDSISIAQVRSLQSHLINRPITRSEKIAVIKNAQLLTLGAQNALLKLLEEPPENCLIFLETDNPKLLLPTIISRCFTLFLPRNETKDSKQKLIVVEKLSLGEKFSLAQEAGKTKQNALEFLKNLQLSLEKDEKTLGKLSKIIDTQKRIKGNANTRLALENLLLDW